MSEEIYTEAQMKVAIKSAWEAGIDWCDTYKGWLTPEKSNTYNHYRVAVRATFKAAREVKSQPTKHALDGDRWQRKKDGFMNRHDLQKCSLCSTPRN